MMETEKGIVQDKESVFQMITVKLDLEWSTDSALTSKEERRGSESDTTSSRILGHYRY